MRENAPTSPAVSARSSSSSSSSNKRHPEEQQRERARRHERSDDRRQISRQQRRRLAAQELVPAKIWTMNVETAPAEREVGAPPRDHRDAGADFRVEQCTDYEQKADP